MIKVQITDGDENVTHEWAFKTRPEALALLTVALEIQFGIKPIRGKEFANDAMEKLTHNIHDYKIYEYIVCTIVGQSLILSYVE